MEEFIKDKIFQFYYKKIYGQKSNYNSFKTFSDKDKVSFLINLYLFISNINSNNNCRNSNLDNNIQISKDNSAKNSNQQDENDIFYIDNYNKIMNNFKSILDKYKNESKDINGNKENNSLVEKYNNNEKLITGNKTVPKDDKNLFPKKFKKNFRDIPIYIKYNYNFESKNKNNGDEDNFSLEENNLTEKEKIIISEKNDIDVEINKPLLKSGSPLCTININSKINKINALKQSQNDENINEENKIIENKNIESNNLINKMEKSTVNKNFISERENNLNDKLFLCKSCPNLNENESSLTNSEKLLVKDLILINSTITEKTRMNLEEFKNESVVEKLIKCPQNKFICLDCTEANKLALVIINLMVTKKELENEIEEEKKRNEIRLNRLKSDFNRRKREIKSINDKREKSLYDTLSLLKKEIADEKKFLDENIKSYYLWDKISIENQKTKEIKENIIKKLESIKK